MPAGNSPTTRPGPRAAAATTATSSRRRSFLSAPSSFGTIGPSLYRFGKLRGSSEAIQKYAYGRIYNSEAFSACSNMPRLGHNGVLTEEQITHLVALLLDPESPVNK